MHKYKSYIQHRQHTNNIVCRERMHMHKMHTMYVHHVPSQRALARLYVCMYYIHVQQDVEYEQGIQIRLTSWWPCIEKEKHGLPAVLFNHSLLSMQQPTRRTKMLQANIFQPIVMWLLQQFIQGIAQVGCFQYISGLEGWYVLPIAVIRLLLHTCTCTMQVQYFLIVFRYSPFVMKPLSTCRCQIRLSPFAQQP